jgi:hypothetical protein
VRWKQGSRVGLLFSLEQRIRAGAHAWGGAILGGGGGPVATAVAGDCGRRRYGSNSRLARSEDAVLADMWALGPF